MMFENVLSAINKQANLLKTEGYDIDLELDENNYLVTISKGKMTATIRDGYFDGVPHNKKAPQLTSYEVFVNTGNSIFAKYVSDYPIDEYLAHLNETFTMINQFFNHKFSISKERVFYFWRQTYMKIEMGDHPVYLVQIKNRPSAG